MRAVERRLEIIKILCRRRHEKMSNLALEFGVSLRTIQRDIDEISTAIPIYIKTGRYEGGVYVVEGYYLDNMYMKENELAVLEKLKNYFLYDDKKFLNCCEIQILNKLIENYRKPK